MVELFGTRLDGALVLVAGLSFLFFLALCFPLLGPDNNRKRIAARAQSLAKRQVGTVEQRKTQYNVRKEEKNVLSGTVIGRYANLVPRQERVRELLMRAGFDISVMDFVIGCFALALVAGAALIFFAGFSVLLAALSSVFIGTGLPLIIVNRSIGSRERRFVATFPDAIELIVRGLKSGLPVTEAMANLARESEEPIRSVFASITDKLVIGHTLNDALWTSAARMPVPDYRYFVISLLIQQETGGNLSEILQNLATMIRKRQQIKLKIRALSSEAKASAMIIGSLPFITGTVIFLVNPGYMEKLFFDPRGWVLLLAATTSLALGVGTMMKLVKVQV